MSSLRPDTDTPGPEDNPIAPDPPALPAGGLARTIRENLFADGKNSVLTIIFGLLLAYILYRAFGFVFLNEKVNPDGDLVDSWQVIRQPLERFMVGTSFNDTGIGFARLWAAIYVVMFALGLSSGAGRHIDDKPMKTRTKLGIVAPPVLAAIVLGGLTETITPKVLILLIPVAFAIGYGLASLLERRFGFARLLSLAIITVGLWQIFDANEGLIVRSLVAVAAAWVVLRVVLTLREALTVRRAEEVHHGDSETIARDIRRVLMACAFLAFVLEVAGRPSLVDDFGGLLLTINVAFISIVLCFPLGVIMALMRRSSFPLLRPLAVIYIELVRGVPLITLLFMGQFALGFFFPPDSTLPPAVIRAIIMFTLFSAAYVAEIVRGGLQSVPAGQTEAGQAVGLSPVTITRKIVLPQALRNSIPALVGQFIALLKDTTLLIIIGLFDLLGVSDPILASPQFQNQGYAPEVYAFVAFMFWIMCFSMSRASQRLETKLGVGTR